MSINSPKKPFKLTISQSTVDALSTTQSSASLNPLTPVDVFDLKERLFQATQTQDGFDESGHDIIQLSSDLDEKLNKLSPDMTYDALDSSEFNPVEYVNILFPNEQAMVTSDTILLKLKSHIQALDKDIKDEVRQQTDAHQQTKDELDQVNIGIQDLIKTIKGIKSKISQSESMILEITQDIKSLDAAKRNILTSVNVLRRIQIIVSALEQLKGITNRKQFKETNSLLPVVVTLSQHLQPYKGVKQVGNLLESVTSFQNSLRKMIMTEFETSLVSGTFKYQAELLNDGCRVLETLGAESKSQLVEWYVESQMKDYRNLFRNNPEVAGIEDISRRYSWLKRLLKTFDESHASLFPTEWKMAEKLVDRYCADTRKDITTQLTAAERSNGLNIDLMLQAIQITMEFEGKLDTRFGATRENMAEVVNQTAAPADSKFYKIISSAFEPYIRHYVEIEDAALAKKFEEWKSTPFVADEECIFTSSTELFLFYRQAMINCTKLSTRKPFVDLSKMFAKWLRSYNDVLLSKLTRDERRPATEEDLKTACYVINTADYCASTTDQLEAKLQEKVDQEFQSLISLTAESDGFIATTMVGIQALVKCMESILDPTLVNMTRKQWIAMTAVGDQSDYITTIGANLSAHIPTLRKLLLGPKMFKTFCDKFAESFLNKLLTNVYKCKPIGEVGGEQMLLDVLSLKTALTQMTLLGADPGTQPSGTFVKILQKGIQKIEQVLKVAIRPLDSPEGIVDTYFLIYADGNMAQFQKILELKGLKKMDMQPLLELFEQKVSKDPNLQLTSGTEPFPSSDKAKAPALFGIATTVAASQPNAGPRRPNSPENPAPPNALNAGALKFKPDFRKFMTNMNMKKT